MTRYMTRKEAGLVPVSGHRRVDHRGQACAHWSATSQTPRARRVEAGEDPPAKPGIKWYRLWRNPLTDPIQRANISRVIRAYNKARREWNEGNAKDTAKLDANAARIWRKFQAYHMKGHGWLDIGYHIGVFAHGLVIEGRPFRTHGAHAGPRANWMLGVCFVMGPGDKVTPEMEQAARDIEDRYGCRIHNAHFDFMATACPGTGPGSITDRILGRGPGGGPRR